MKVIVVVILATLLAACEPADRRPGTWISGEVVEDKVKDWTFSDEHMEVFIQTHPWYGIPHSVTTVLATTDGALYVPSIYYQAEETYPNGKYWNKIVDVNPYVFVQIGDKKYPRLARRVTDDAEFDVGFKALAQKYEFWQKQYDNPAERPLFYILRLHDFPDHSNEKLR